MDIRSLVSKYLMDKRNPPPPPGSAEPFDVAVSDSSSPVSGAMPPMPPAAPPVGGMADPRTPSPADALLASLPAGAAPEPPQMPPDAPPPPSAPAPLPGTQPPAAPPAPDAGAPFPQNPADIVRAAMDRAPAGPAAPPPPPPAAADDSQTGMSIIGKALAALGDARMAGAGQKGNFLEIARAEDQAHRGETRQNETDARARAEFSRQQTSLKAQDDPASAESKFAQNYIAKLTGKKPEDYASLPYARAKELLPTVEKAWAAQEASEGRKAAASLTVGTKESQQQDRLEQQARQAVQSLRGDKSLADAEAKRDAAITVYKTIDQIKGEGRMPSKAEYYDLLGQMWKARTGSSPSDEAIRHLDSQTFKGDIGKAMTYITGSPSGGTTRDVLNNIQAFAANSGVLADQLHDGYMKTHLIKPKDLADDRWQPIISTGRGLSFSDATGYKGSEARNTAANEVRRKAPDGRVIVYDATTKKPLRVEE